LIFTEYISAPTFSVGGYVKNALNNQVIPGASVILSNGEKTTTDTQGRYSFVNLPVGKYNMNATASGFISGEVVFDLNQDIQRKTRF
jgi:hypothetical protein